MRVDVRAHKFGETSSLSASTSVGIVDVSWLSLSSLWARAKQVFHGGIGGEATFGSANHRDIISDR